MVGCTWVWASSGSWWWTGKPGMLQSMGSQRLGHGWMTELNWRENWQILETMPSTRLAKAIYLFQGGIIKKKEESSKEAVLLETWLYRILFFFRQNFIGELTLAGRSENKQEVSMLTCSLIGGWVFFLYGMRVRVCPGVEPEGWLRCFVHSSGGVDCRGHEQYPAFAPNTCFLLQVLREWQWVFLVCIFCLEFVPTTHACSYF